MGSAPTVMGDGLCCVHLLGEREFSYSTAKGLHVKQSKSRFLCREARKGPEWHHQTPSTVSWVFRTTSLLASLGKCTGSKNGIELEVLDIVPDLEHHLLFCVSIFLINKTRIIAFALYSFCASVSMRDYQMEKVFHIQMMLLSATGMSITKQRGRVKLR